MAEVYGGDVYLIINDDYFANERGVENNESTDSLETTHKHTPNKRKTFIGGESTGTITANGVYEVSDDSGYKGYHTLKALQKARTAVTYEIGVFSTGGIIETGTGIITACNLTGANNNEIAVFNITIQKTGDYTEDTYSS